MENIKFNTKCGYKVTGIIFSRCLSCYVELDFGGILSLHVSKSTGCDFNISRIPSFLSKLIQKEDLQDVFLFVVHNWFWRLAKLRSSWKGRNLITSKWLRNKCESISERCAERALLNMYATVAASCGQVCSCSSGRL
jgi:hypothetical protein